jgi:ATP adenylyltransferase
MEYLESEKVKECIFCAAAEEGEDHERYVLYRGKHSFIMLNKYPYTSGHFMVVPYRHTSELEQLRAEEMSDMMVLAQKGLAALKMSYQPQGFNIGINIGGVAGAGIEDHIHLHVVPRWKGDTNFMPVVSDTRVMPQSLESTYQALLKHIGE